MQGPPVILKWHNLQSLDIALDIFIEFKFCESEFYFLNGSKKCMVATYNFGSVYLRNKHSLKLKQISLIKKPSKIYLCMEKTTIKSFFFGSHLGCHIVSRLSYELSTNNKVTS